MTDTIKWNSEPGGTMQQALIRARQVKALYQRELTALNRNLHLDEASRKMQAESLWSQANNQIDRLRESVGEHLDALTGDQRSLLDPPKRPPYLDAVE